MMNDPLFWRHVDRSGECWLWTGAHLTKGYGIMARNRKRWLAHRYSYTMANGPIPDGMLVLHSCDNPPCVRPSHLHLGDNRTNAREAVERGQIPTGDAHHNRRHPERLSRGSSRYNAIFTEDEVREFRRMHAAGWKVTDIARHFGLPSHYAIYPIVRGEYWKHVQ